MTNKEAYKVLKAYQKWRMGDADDYPDVKKISEALEYACELLKSIGEGVQK